jgi:hypothetical protein
MPVGAQEKGKMGLLMFGFCFVWGIQLCHGRLHPVYLGKVGKGKDQVRDKSQA